MPKIIDKICFSDEKRRKFQRRLSHFFKDYKYKNSLLSKDMAESFGYTAAKFSELESDTKPHSRFINSLEFLAGIAAIQEMPLSKFIAYLEGSSLDQDGINGSKANLYPWQRTLLESFDPLSIITRKAFVQICEESQKNDKSKLEVILQISAILNKCNLNLLKIIRDGLQEVLSSVK